MKKMLITCAFLFLLLPMGLTHAQDDDNNLSAEEVERIAQAVVRIETFTSTGSGTLISPTGRIFTNRHVIEDSGGEYAIYMQEVVGEPPALRYYASLVAAFDEIDFAILQIDRDANRRPIDAESLTLPYIDRFAERVTLAMPVVIFGYPAIGDGYLVVTQGSVTSVENETVFGARMPLWYRTDAQISPGNSGGLAVNLNGEFIGIPTEVRKEDDTLGRLAGLLAYPTIMAVMDAVEEGLTDVQTEPMLEASLTLIHNGNTEICGVYISATTNTSWGQNLLDGVLENGDSQTWSLSSGDYDILLQDCREYDVLDLRGQRINGSVTLNYPDGELEGDTAIDGLTVDIILLDGGTADASGNGIGTTIYITAEAEGYADVPLRVVAMFFWEDVTPVACDVSMPEYCTLADTLIVEDVITPEFDSSTLEIALWIPDEALPSDFAGERSGFAIAGIGPLEGDLLFSDSVMEFTIAGD